MDVLYTITPDVTSEEETTSRINTSCKTGLYLYSMKVEDFYPPQCQAHSLFIYGSLLPILAVLVTIANITIVAVFLKPHVRSHTTFILTMIAAADTLAIVFPAVMYVYFYTMGNYDDHIPFSMCRWTYIMCDVLRDSFNSISIWLTVILAYVRYRCIHSPFTARTVHSGKNIVIAIALVVVFSVCTHVPSLFLLDFTPSVIHSTYTNTSYETCTVSSASFEGEHACTYRRIHVWSEIIFGSIIPCTALLTLDVFILLMLRRATISRDSLRRRNTAPHDAQHRIHKHCNRGNRTVGVAGTRNNPDINLNEDIATSSKLGPVTVGDRVIEDNIESPAAGKHVQIVCNLDGNNCKAQVISTDDHQTMHLSSMTALSKNVHAKLSKVKKVFNHKRQRSGSVGSEDSAYEKLDRESRRTSWLIIIVVTIIISHEVPMAMLLARLVATTDESLPLNLFGCSVMYLQLWGYIAYPLIFLIYCCMSSAFREELLKTLSCSCLWHHDNTHDNKAKHLFMSPCRVRRRMRNTPRVVEEHNNMDELYKHIVDVNDDLVTVPKENYGR